MFEDGGWRFVEEEKIDVIGMELAQAGFEAGAQGGYGEVAGRELGGDLMLHGFAGAGCEAQQRAGEGFEGLLEGCSLCGEDAELGGESDGMAAVVEELAEQGFGFAVAVRASGVVEGDACVVGSAKGRERGFAACATEDGGAAKAERGASHGGVAGRGVLHD